MKRRERKFFARWRIKIIHRGGTMKRVMEIQVNDRVFDRGISFKVREFLIDAQGLIRFRDMQGHLHGPYVPGEFIGVKRPGEKGDCNGVRSRAELRQDEDERELYKNSYCAGAPDC